jgi:para-nitrobenzyl esterase
VSESMVDTRSGKAQGYTRDGVHVFKGIPFARPPVGPLRFQPPQPPEPWAGVLDATRYGKISAQLQGRMERLFGAPPIESSEDSLTLNVWTPGLDDARRPVMVWIHGGAFVNGTGSTPWYNGIRFATAGDVVVVTINYRLGGFGFLHLADLGGERFASSGNAGILDQVAALEWVRDNIDAFGGDPGNVMIFGESAGAMSVGTLLGTPAARGLFHRAALQSGSSSAVFTRDDATKVAEQLIVAAGLAPGDVDGLVALPTEALLAAQGELLAHRSALYTPFRPVVDGTALPSAPLDAIAAGREGDVPTLVGTTLDETTLFFLADPKVAALDETGLLARARELLGDGAEKAVATYTATCAGASPRDVLIAITTDWAFRIPAIRLAEAQAVKGRPAFMYLFTWATPVFGGALKSCHALELPFVFDNLQKGRSDMFTGDGPERQGLADRMHSAWIAFAHTSDPGWPAYDLEDRATVVFSGEPNRVEPDPMGAERRLWEGVSTDR